jgi:urease accessory protein
MDTLNLLHGLRFIDTFFPSGGYAYSSGLEAAVQSDQIRNAEDLSSYVEDLFRRGLGRCEAVAVGLGHDAVASGALQLGLSVDQELDAMKLSRDARMASRQMGRQMLRSAGEQAGPSSTLRRFITDVEGDRSPGHLAVSLGMTLASCGWSRQDTIAAFLYHTAVGFVSASLKLLPVGQREGQRLLARWMPLIVEVSRQVEHHKILSSWSPVQDIYSMRHAHLTTRLFRS